MSMMPDVNANLNPRFDFNDSCNCCFPMRKKKERENKTSEVANEVLKPESHKKKPKTSK